MKLLAALAALATVRSDTTASDAMGVAFIDFDAMYTGECSGASGTSATSAAAPASESDYVENYDQYYKDTSSSSSSSSSSSADPLNKALCDCLAKSGVRSASGSAAYASAMQAFMDCVSKADAAEMQRIARYERSLLPDSNANATTTAAAEATEQDSNPAQAAAAADSSSSAKANDTDSDSDSADFGTTQQAQLSTTEAGSAAVLMGVGVDATDDRFGHAAMYIMFIGVSVLLFVCAWFVKGSLRSAWGKGGYDAVSYASEADADDRGDPYNHGGDDWEDMYDHNASAFKQEKQRKGKFADWNQYNAV